MNKLTPEKAAEIMGVTLEDVTSSSLGAAYKTAVKLHHPDHGGEPDAFMELMAAKQVLLIWLERHLNAPTTGGCLQCDGRGYVIVNHGFTSLRKQCICQLKEMSQ